MKIAAAAYPVDALPERDALAAKLTAWVADAGDADLLVFPEYAGLEAGLIGATAPLSVAEECARCSEAAPAYWAILSGLAAAHGKVILAGSLPVQTSQGWRNRAALIRPDGQAAFIDKVQLTPWERTETPLEPGAGAGVFRLEGLPPFAVLICYDGEFPLQARALAEDGAEVLLMPSATEAETGHQRVRLAARARALESGGQTVLSQIIGTCPVSAFADVSRGRAGHYGPPDAGWPADGILTETEPDVPGWATARLHKPDLPPQVTIASDWHKQQTAPPAPVFTALRANRP